MSGFPRTHRSILLRNYFTSKKLGAQKKKVAAIASMLGNIEAHFPDMKDEFVASLKEYYPEVFILAVEEGVIPGVHAMPTEIPGCTRIACDHRPLTAHGVKEIPGLSPH